MKWVLLACSPAPGLVQFLNRRYRRGFLLLLAGLAGLNGVAVLGPNLRPVSTGALISAVSWFALIAAAGLSIIDTIRHVVLLDRDKLASDKRRLLDRGIECYLKGDAEGASLYFTRLAHIDPRDADSRMYLASSLRAAGDAGGARRNFKRAAALNPGKWSWEAGVALKELGEVKGVQGSKFKV
jgi:tetratricopeptide (TPR) repeat protein